MFDRFTERARKVMTLARQEAQGFNHDYIGTEHILLGLVSERHGVAHQVLENLGLDLDKVRSETERCVERGGTGQSVNQLPFTTRAKRVLECALEESQNLGHVYIGTEHLLLGVLRERDGPAALVLANLGVLAGEVRDEILRVLQGEGGVERARPEVGALDEALAAHVDAMFPKGGVFAGADFRRSALGHGVHVVIQWRPDPEKPPRASIAVTAERIEALRERLPAVLDLLAGLVKEGEARGGGKA